MIRSAIVKDDLWLVIDRTFKPQDNRVNQEGAER
jgi:hypothetical protein